MFYLKKVFTIVEERRAWEKLKILGETLAERGITMKAGNSGDLCGKDTPEEATLWITDTKAVADALIAKECPLLIYLHPWNKEESFPLAGFAMEEPQELEVSYLENVYRRFAGIPWDIVSTPRCLVREMTPEDALPLQEIYRHPQIQKYLAEERDDPEQYRRYIELYIQQVYGFYGYGIWTVLDCAGKTVIGRAGFRYRDGEAPELGYMIGVPWQRQGLAYEVCSAILEYGREVLEFEQVQALVEPDNQASISLCKKLGFIEQGKVAEEGRECIRFYRSLQ